MSSSKIQEYNLDPNMGLAKEESVQGILGKISNTGFTCFPNLKMETVTKSMSANTNKQTMTFAFSGARKIHSVYLVINHGNETVTNSSTCVQRYTGVLITVDGTTYNYNYGSDSTISFTHYDKRLCLKVDNHSSVANDEFKIYFMYDYRTNTSPYTESYTEMWDYASFICNEAFSITLDVQATNKEYIYPITIGIFYEDL